MKVLFAPYTLINSSESAPTGWSNGWYVAEGSVTISDRVTVNGSVNLILKDGAKLIAEQGITVSDGNSFAVYAQSTGDNMGWLQATNAKLTDSAALGGEMGSAGSITINGGHLEATASGNGAAIGGGAGAGGGSITITGGVVTAVGGRNARIGGSEDADDVGKFSTSKMNGDPGNAVIFAGSITDTSDKDNWSGLIFLNNTGSIYGGNSYTLNNDIDLSWNQTLTIEDGETFTVAGGVTLNNEGHIMIRTGGSYIGGLIEGNQVEFEIQWDIDGDGSTNESTFVAYGQIPSHADGVKNSTEPEKYVNVFDRWEPALVEATQPASYSAQFTPTEVLYKVTMPAEAGCKVQYAGSSAVPYETKITFTVELADGYRKTGDFAVQANGVPLQEEGDGSYRLTVTEDIEITVEGVEAIPATPTPTATPAPTAVPGPVEIPVKAPATVTGATAAAELEENALAEAVAQAKEEAQASGGGPVVIVTLEGEGINEAQGMQVSLPPESLAELAGVEGASLTVESPAASVTFASQALTAIARQADAAVVLVVEPVSREQLNEAQAQVVDQEPVFELTLQCNGVVIADFEAGNATVSLPYALAQGRQAEDVVVWYLVEEGGTTPCETSYDAQKQLATFTTPHFSKYMVGYEGAQPAEQPETQQQPADAAPDAAPGAGVGLPVILLAVVAVLLIAAFVLRRIFLRRDGEN